MEEQIILSETAILANTKGFDIIQTIRTTSLLYNKIGEHIYYANYGFQYSGLSDGYISGPTQSFLQKWLRDTHKMKVLVVIVVKKNKDNDEEEYYRPMWGYRLKDKWFNDDYYEKYEDALEIGLQKGLENLIIP